jgi:hypothetical protein
MSRYNSNDDPRIFVSDFVVEGFLIAFKFPRFSLYFE